MPENLVVSYESAQTLIAKSRLVITVSSTAALEAIEALGLAQPDQVEPVIELLWRLCAMLTKLARLGR